MAKVVEEDGMINCYVCDKKISENIIKCPYCKAMNISKKRKITCIFIIITNVLISGFLIRTIVSSLGMRKMISNIVDSHVGEDMSNKVDFQGQMMSLFDLKSVTDMMFYITIICSVFLVISLIFLIKNIVKFIRINKLRKENMQNSTNEKNN